LWASDIQYLNDSRDYGYAFDVFKRAFAACRRRRNEAGRRLIEFTKAALKEFQGWQTFVTSFSEDGDLLSQWRGYCPPGQGLSLGFPVEMLRERAAAQSFEFAPCIYDPSEQRAMAVDMIEKRLDRQGDEDPTEADGLGLAFALHELAARLKHPAFSEEKEWRLVSKPHVVAIPGLEFREGRSFIVPYRQFALAASADRLVTLGDITIGPTPHPRLAQQSVLAIIRKQFITTGPVRISKAPYRVW